MEKYDHKQVEAKWRKKWADSKQYATPEIKEGEDKFYSLYSFPYPSGAGLHVGHVEGMVVNDIVARYWRMKGRKVILPMGWDSFGLPAENYAIKTGIHPEDSTEEIIVTFKEQIEGIGISVDWDTEVAAHWPSYYKWTQWLFLQFFKAGLAYKKSAPVNWCPKDQTVLANEQVINGKCERCDTEVIQKEMEQWFFKITDFADELDADLDTVDWPEGTKAQQRNWIGKKSGINIRYQIDGADKFITCFSTRPDTNFGATFIVLAPDGEALKGLLDVVPNTAEVEKYIAETAKKTELERQQEGRKKTGVFTGLYAVNRLNDKKLPVYVSDFVLANFGTGAVVGVPAHDQRDFEFAQAMGIEIVRVVVGEDGDESAITDVSQLVEGAGTVINSDFLNGLRTHEAIEKVMDHMEKEGFGERVTTYRMRDWLLSRQRYWGCPIPIVYDPEGNPHPVDEADLPVLLPRDVDFKPTGESPLTRSVEFQKDVEEKYGKGWRREMDTMDTFVDSSWYFFRHTDAQNTTEFASKEKMNSWLPTDLYMIGAEHIVLHLLYARFFTKFLNKQGYIKFNEPFLRMRHMGTILGPDGRKMSKRWGNVINPTDIIAEMGADSLRLYEMFMGPIEVAKPWNPKAVQGVNRFVNRVLRANELFMQKQSVGSLKPQMHRLIKRVSDDIQVLGFNTSVAEFMKVLNEIEANPDSFSRSDWETYLTLLAPFAPFVTEELWMQLGHDTSIHLQRWPDYDPKQLVDETITVAVQISGKVRDTITISKDATEAEALELAKKSPKVQKYIDGQQIRKELYIPGRIVNIVI